MFKRWNLSSRLTLVILLLVLATNLVMIFAFNFGLEKRSKAYYTKTKDQIVDSVGSYYPQSLSRSDMKMIEDISKGLLKNEIVEGLQVVDRSDQVVFEFTKIPKKISELEKDLQFKSDVVDIYEQHELVGKVHLLFSNRAFQNQNQTMIFRMVLVFLVFSLLIIFGSYFSLKKILQTPLNILLKAIQSSTSSNYEVRINESFNSEFNILANEFNLAMAKIQKSESILKEYNAFLEAEVDSRSKELDQKRAQMINSARLASLGEFSAGMAHEINNPLTVISGTARILLLYVEKGLLDAKYAEQINKILQMSHRIEMIIKSLRTFARDGKNDEMSQFSTDKFLNDISTLTKIKLEKNHIRFEVINNSTVPSIFGQEVPLSQVIINLINNAADAVIELDEKWVRLEMVIENKNIIFKVTDSGKGIPPEIREKMMHPFFTTKDVGKGTGLGLSISEGIMKQHNGQLRYNDESINTQFILSLPLDLNEQIKKTACA